LSMAALPMLHWEGARLPGVQARRSVASLAARHQFAANTKCRQGAGLRRVALADAWRAVSLSKPQGRPTTS
jgi:hypothetical protein